MSEIPKSKYVSVHHIQGALALSRKTQIANIHLKYGNDNCIEVYFILFFTFLELPAWIVLYTRHDFTTFIIN